MALKHMLLINPKLWENRSQQSLPPPPVKKIIKSKDHSYNKWTHVRFHEDPYLKTEERKRERIPNSHNRNWRYKMETYKSFSATVLNRV